MSTGFNSPHIKFCFSNIKHCYKQKLCPTAAFKSLLFITLLNLKGLLIYVFHPVEISSINIEDVYLPKGSVTVFEGNVCYREKKTCKRKEKSDGDANSGSLRCNFALGFCALLNSF